MDRSAARLESYLLELYRMAQECVSQSCNYHPHELGQVLRIDADIQIWERCIANRPEVAQLSRARRELGFAVYAASSALYGHAFAGLRLFLELSFASVYFSVHELHRRRWASNRADFSWSAALNEDDGVLSNSFIQEFNSEAAAESAIYAARASAAYRECSEFMHGKLRSTSLIPDTLTFSPEMLARWARAALASSESVLFLLYCRYVNDYLDDHFSTLHDTLEHSFSHLASVRRRIGLPIEGESI